MTSREEPEKERIFDRSIEGEYAVERLLGQHPCHPLLELLWGCGTNALDDLLGQRAGSLDPFCNFLIRGQPTSRFSPP